MVKHAQRVAIVVGEEAFVAVSYLEPEPTWESGFAVFSVPAEEVEDHDSELVCLHCLLDDHPELGRGLDVAREHGVAGLDEQGEWVALTDTLAQERAATR